MLSIVDGTCGVFSNSFISSLSKSHLTVMSVTGLFRERVERHSLIRWFQRVFVIIPNPATAGFCIVNEQLHITCATSEQIKSAFKGLILRREFDFGSFLKFIFFFFFYLKSSVWSPHHLPLVLLQ